MRGKVLGLSLDQVAARARYLASDECVAGYYLLKDYNGGKDPTAADPFDRWTKPGGKTVNRTADCIGGAAWCGGFDRYQPSRFAHIYSGWINTDSMIMDAKGPAKCFEVLGLPTPGCFVVAPSNSPGHTIGHIGVVIDVPAEWDPEVADCWKRLAVVDVASRGAGVRANRQTTGVGWHRSRRQGAFVRSLMSV